MMPKILLFCLLVTGSQTLAGCVMPQTVSDERLKQALQLVDQGTSHLREGKLHDAHLAFSMAEELAPIAPAVDGQGCVALLSGEFGRAETLFKRAYDMDGTYDHALANLALLKDISGQHEEAKMLYDKAIEAFPESVLVRNNRAALEYDRGARKMEVVDELQKAGLIAYHPVIRENLARLGHPMPERSKQPERKNTRSTDAGVGTAQEPERGEFVM